METEKKIRAFLKEKSKMFSFKTIRQTKNFYKLIISNRACIMLFTGFKDKNDIEIYEGDICKYYNRIGVIKYSKKAPRFILFSEHTEFEIDYMMPKVMEVLGNVFENEDLLNDKQLSKL